jgi:Flp pilus assembly protein TadG
MTSISSIWRRLPRSARGLRGDCRGVAAIEFAIIAPIMLLAFFGTVEFCSAIAVDRKVTLVARTLSDLTSQNVGVTDAQLTAYFTVSQKILWPYTNTPKATITELHIEPGSLAPRVQWSVGTNQHSVGSVLTIPSALLVSDTYLIYSEVTYKYIPTVGYLLAAAGIDLSDVAYTRPRQNSCVLYNTTIPTKRPRCWARPLTLVDAFSGWISRGLQPRRKSFSWRRADCRPTTCQSGGPPRSRKRSSGLHATCRGRRARRPRCARTHRCRRHPAG